MTWYAKQTGGYLMGSTEADSNATEMAHILMNSFGWTFEACCGMFGNIDAEGGWNPWRWQADQILSQSQARNATGSYMMDHGYGLIGWTPAKKYQFNNAVDGDGDKYFPDYDQESYPGYGPNFSDVPGLATDGQAQTILIGTAMANNSGNIWVLRKSCTASRFITLTNVRNAAYYWLWNAEYPTPLTPAVERTRMNNAVSWYQHLGGLISNKKYIIFKKVIDHNHGRL